MKKHIGLIILFFLVISIQCGLGFWIYKSFPDFTDRGTFGDMFGAVNTLFSGLAFAGVIYAIFLQSQELELQREELRDTREELAKSAKAQTEQAELMVQAAEINALGSQLNAYATMFAATSGVAGKHLYGEKINLIMTRMDELLKTTTPANNSSDKP